MKGPVTVQLGQFTEANAQHIVDRLAAVGIVHWTKGSGPLTRLLSAGDWGIRVFVDESRLEEADVIAREVTDG